MFRGTSPKGIVLLSFCELTRDAFREQLAYESHFTRSILADLFSVGVNSGQLASK